MLFDKLETILGKVQKPSRYTGGEHNSVIKDKSSVAVRFALCFPDLYEIGMSHLGSKILYSLCNAREDIWCERVFAPDVDMEALMRARNIPLYGLESLEPLREFDIIGFSLQYEMCYPTVLNMLDLAGLPVRSQDRTSLSPLVIAGGPCVCNPEPMSDFIDLFALGDGEELMLDIAELYKEAKKNRWDKHIFLKNAAKIQGVYVPSLYNVSYNNDGTVEKITASDGAPHTVRKRIVADLDSVHFPEKFVVPYIEVVHDRSMLEVLRGCLRGCRFCQAGFIYRPYREKNPEILGRGARSLCESTGYDEISLTSLSTSDYSGLAKLLPDILSWSEKERVNLSLPSLRVDNFSPELLEQIARVRKSGLTFAPEAGSQRLRDVINKNITEDEVLNTCKTAFLGGYTGVKLYFMLGLPTETMDDIASIAELCQKIVDMYYSLAERPKGKAVNVTISAACFVPKPFTPFEFEPQDTMEMFMEKQKFLKSRLTSNKISFRYHDSPTSMLEAVLARGDRRLSGVIESTWRKGAKLDGWDEHFSLDRWLESFTECNISYEFYANRRRKYSEIMPWSHIDYGVAKAFLIAENKKAHAGITTENCREQCHACGAAKLFAENVKTKSCPCKTPQADEVRVPNPPCDTTVQNAAAPIREDEVRTSRAIEQMPMVRVFFSKTGCAKYTSHLDTMRTLTRAFRRSGLPVWYTQGFNPHLYMTFALPVALGYESLCESVDIRLTEDVEFESVTKKLNLALPPGFKALRAATPVMQPAAISFADYDVRLVYEKNGDISLLQKLGAFLALPVIEVEKKTKKGMKTVDIKPLSKVSPVGFADNALELKLRMAAGISLNINPTLLLKAFYDWSGVTPDGVKITRTAILDSNGSDFA